MDKIILLFCSFISCFIIINLLFQFMNDRFIKVYQNKLIYAITNIVSVLFIMFINMSMNYALNLFTNILLFALISLFLYSENNPKKFIRLFEAEVLLAVSLIAETIGVFLINILLSIMYTTPIDQIIEKSIQTVFSKIVLIFFYYTIFIRIWHKNSVSVKKQYALYITMFIYSITSFLAIASLSSKESPIALILIVGCTFFANMYLLYFIKYSEERNYYKMQYEMMAQQKKLQFDCYEVQQENYTKSISIIHDVEKHIKTIENLWQNDCRSEVVAYSKQIVNILRPLAPFQYTDNTILNCIISDKVKAAEKLGISVQLDINDVDISFMEPIDITTLFANLLDNAINACSKCNSQKYIGFFLNSHNGIVSIRIENSFCEQIQLINGRIKFVKEHAQSGIGLLNIQQCVDTYNGNILYKINNKILICDIIFNKID